MIFECQKCRKSFALPDAVVRPIKCVCELHSDSRPIPYSGCIHRSDELRRELCSTCRGRVDVKVFACDIHGECTIGKKLPGITCCSECTDAHARVDIPSVSKLAIVTSFFNPHRGRNRVRIYSRFSEAIKQQGLSLFCVEGSFRNQSSQVDSTWKVPIDSNAIFWHKERMLQWAIDRLPDRFDAVCWIDADVVYETPKIGDVILDALTRNPIVQPWSNIRYLGPDNKPMSDWKSSLSLHNSTKAWPTADPRRAYPGMCWAAARSTLAKIAGGIYDRCITGGGDVAWASGVWGDYAPLYVRHWSASLTKDVIRWCRGVTPLTGGRSDVVHARAEHLYHGEVKNRMYVERNAIFRKYNYDPQRDVELDKNEMLRWSKFSSPILREAVSVYMHGRKEDE